MGLQVAERQRVPAWQVFPVIEAVAGFGSAQNLMALSNNNRALVQGGGSYSNATIGVSFGCTYVAGAVDYDPDFVASILKADAAEPEASFDNVVDMLDWLNRD
jgi:hypothetical protein